MNDLATSAIIERAFELARSGEFQNASGVAKALQKAGFARVHIEDHLLGKATRKQLTRLCRAARSCERGS